jgi:hypothetical protein
MVSWTSGRLISAGCDRWEYLSSLLMKGGKEFVRIYADKKEIFFDDKRCSVGREIVKNRAKLGYLDKFHGVLDNSSQGATKESHHVQ